MREPRIYKIILYRLCIRDKATKLILRVEHETREKARGLQPEREFRREVNKVGISQ